MVTHLVYFSLKPEAEGRTGAENAALLVERLKQLRGKVPGLRALEAGVNVIQGPDAYDVGLYTQFDDMEGLEAYRVHPAHVEVVEFVKAVTDGRSAVDFES